MSTGGAPRVGHGGPGQSLLVKVRDDASGTIAARGRPALRLAFTLVCVVASCVAATHGDAARIGDWGLIQALPPVYFAGAALLCVAFVFEVFRRRGCSTWVLVAQVVAMTVVFHGVPGFLEQEPRFATSWLHAGFTDQILQHGVAVPGYDARFNWPGFFSAAAAVTGSAGLTSALPLLRWAPVVMNLLCLPPLYAIGRQLTGSRRASWLGLGLWLLVNWVGQNYFSPQAAGYVLYLIGVAVIVIFFRQGTRWGSLQWIRHRHQPPPVEGLPDVVARPAVRVALVLLLLLISAALAMTHQLSPVMFTIAAAALVAVGRCRLVTLPVIAGILTLGWISVGATAYWAGHLDVMFGGLGDITRVLASSVGSRVTGAPAHLRVVRIRLAFTAVVWAGMGLAALLLRLRGHRTRTLLALAIAPLGLLVQSYGTEGVLRIFFFSAPFAVMIIAQLLTDLNARGWLRSLTAVLALALIPTFLITRYGNEAFEQVRVDEVQAVQQLYRIAPKGSRLVSPTTQVAWGDQYLVDYKRVRPTHPAAFRKGDLHAVRYLVGGRKRTTYVLVTTGQILYAAQTMGSPPDWFTRLRAELTPENGYRLLYHNPDAWIYRYEAPS